MVSVGGDRLNLHLNGGGRRALVPSRICIWQFSNVGYVSDTLYGGMAQPRFPACSCHQPLAATLLFAGIQHTDNHHHK